MRGLLDDLIRPREEFGRKCQSDLLCRLQVDDELKLGRLLHREIFGLNALQDLVNVPRYLPVAVRTVRTVVQSPIRAS